MKTLTAYQLGLALARMGRPANPEMYKTAKAQRLHMQGYQEGRKMPSLARALEDRIQ